MSQALKQLWKHSSSLIIVGKNVESTKLKKFNYKVCDLNLYSVMKFSSFFQNTLRMNVKMFWFVLYNWKVLVLEREKKGSYPGALVFPGGVTENADHAKDWLNLYRKFGIDDSKFQSITKTCPNRSFIFQCDEGNSISRWVCENSCMSDCACESDGKWNPQTANLFSLNVMSFSLHYWQWYFITNNSYTWNIWRARHINLQK